MEQHFHVTILFWVTSVLVTFLSLIKNCISTDHCWWILISCPVLNSYNVHLIHYAWSYVSDERNLCVKRAFHESFWATNMWNVQNGVHDIEILSLVVPYTSEKTTTDSTVETIDSWGCYRYHWHAKLYTTLYRGATIFPTPYFYRESWGWEK